MLQFVVLLVFFLIGLALARYGIDRDTFLHMLLFCLPGGFIVILTLAMLMVRFQETSFFQWLIH